MAIQKNKKHGVEHRDFDINSTRAAKPSMDFRKPTGFGVEVYLFDFRVGSHHDDLAPGKSKAQLRGSGASFKCGVNGAVTHFYPIRFGRYYGTLKANIT